MDPFHTLQDLPTWLVGVVICLIILIVLAVINHVAARLAERRHPPTGSFMEVDGVKLHYSDRGEGRPVVLVHGNAVTGDDYNTSGVAERLIGTYRVIIFDRPGFGYSGRPRRRVWTAAAQADLLHAALKQLGIQRPVLVGHSWGTLVALALAVRHPADTAGLILLSGYYFPTPRVDVLPVAVLAIPVLGDILSHTVSPVFGWLMMPAMKRAMFAPSPMTPRFAREYSSAMELRPSQLRASAVDGTLMVPGAMSLSAHYTELTMPMAIMAGDGDLIVSDKQAERLHTAVPGSALQVVEGVGHMIHHVATQQVVAAIETVMARSSN
jgi:pimeloyl-ACP methyl ester carboxylesterase